MQLYYIRHAQSENNRLYAEAGDWRDRNSDPAITGLGRQQAERLATFLQTHGRPEQDTGYDGQNAGGFRLTHLYCSLMIRSVATGVVVAQALRLPLVAWESAHETGGIFRIDPKTEGYIGLPGRNRAFFEEHYPLLRLCETLAEEGWWNRPFEQLEARSLRARRFVDELLARHGDTEDRVAVISHGGFYNHVLRVLLGMTSMSESQDRQIYFALSNTGITRIDFEGEQVGLQYANRTDHLPPELIT